MSNRLDSGLSQWRSGKSTGSTNTPTTSSSRLDSSLEEWKKKKGVISPTPMQAEQPMSEPEPIVSKPVDQVQHENTQDGDFMAGLKTYIPQTKQLLSGATMVIANATGNEEASKKALENYRSAEKDISPLQAGRKTSLESIKNFGDAADYAQYTLGNLVGSAIESMASATVGGLIGSSVPGAGTAVGAVSGFVAKGYIKKQLEKEVTKQVAKGVAIDVAQESAKKVVQKNVSAGIGMFSSSYIQGVGDIQGEIMDEQGKGNAITSFVGAIPYAIVDSIGDMMTLGRAIGGSEGVATLKKYAKSLLKEGNSQGIQEVIQELDLLISGVINDKTYSVKEVISRLGNSYSAAFLGGAVAGIPGGRQSNQGITTPLPSDSTTPTPPGGTPPTPTQDVPFTETPTGSTPIDNTPIQPSKEVETLISSIQDNGIDQRTVDATSKKTLEEALVVFDNIVNQVPEEDRAQIESDRSVIEEALANKSENIISTLASDVEKGTNNIDTLSPADRETAIEHAKSVAESNIEVSDRAKKILDQVEQNNKDIQDIAKEIKAVKADLLAKKNATEDKELKKALQGEIDIIDKNRHSIEEQKNKVDKYSVPDIDKQEFAEKNPTHTFQTVLDNGKKVNVAYTEKKGYPAHFEFRGMATSNTGYKSDFFGAIGEKFTEQKAQEIAKIRAEIFAKEQDRKKSEKKPEKKDTEGRGGNLIGSLGGVPVYDMTGGKRGFDTASKEELDDFIAKGEERVEENKVSKATSKSVRDNNQLVSIKDGEVTVTSKSGNKRYANVLGGTPSKQAQQLFLLSQLVQKKNNGRNIFLASATPFENHATEVYNILMLVARDRMKEMGLQNINDFFSVYSNFEVELDRSIKGEWVNRKKMKSFANIQSLKALVTEFIDFQEDPTLVRPDKKVFTPHLQMSEKQIENLQKIQDLLRGVVRDGDSFTEGKAKDGAFLTASQWSITNGISPYFIEGLNDGVTPTAEEIVNESPKIKFSLEYIREMKRQPRTRNYGAFLYFGKQGVEYHPMLAAYFAKELGYKQSEVAFISGAMKQEEKDDIVRRFNSGEVKVLLGGDQTKEGIDLQGNAFVTINLALGWNPTEITQTGGRVWRQGNPLSFVHEIFPLVENSGDLMMYNKFEEKGGRINQISSASGKTMDVGEVNASEQKIALMTDPEGKALFEIEMNKADFEEDKVILSEEISNFERIKSDIDTYKQTIETYQNRLKSSYNSESDIKEYKKGLTSAQGKLKRALDNLLKKGITYEDIPKKISGFKAEVEVIDKNIKEIQSTLPELLKKYLNEQAEQIKNRKSIKQQIGEMFADIESLKVYTKANLMEMKAKKIAEIEERKKLTLPSFIAKDHPRDTTGKFKNKTVNEQMQIVKKEVEQQVEEWVASEKALRVVEKLQKITNPAIISNVEIAIVGSMKNGMEGALDPRRAIAYLAETNMDYENISEREFLNHGKHELKHMAFLMLPDRIQQAVVAWSKTLSDEQLIKIYGDKERLQRYRESFANGVTDWRGNRQTEDLAFADETLNQWDDEVRKKNGDPIEQTEWEQWFSDAKFYLVTMLKTINDVFIRSKVINRKTGIWISEHVFRDVFVESGNFEGKQKRFNLPKGFKQSAARRGVTEYGQITNRQFDFTKNTDREGITIDDIGSDSYVPAFDTDQIEVEASLPAFYSNMISDSGRVKIAELFRKTYMEIYGTKAPALNIQDQEKIIRGVSKRSFTLGKRYGKKITKDNYKQINNEIRAYIVSNVEVKDRGSLVRAVVAAKNEGDVQLLAKRVDKIVNDQLMLKEARATVIAIEKEKDLKKIENLRKAMKLPTLKEMTVEELNKYIEVLSQAEYKDSYLTQRMIETVKLTSLKGMKTKREVLGDLEKRIGTKNVRQVAPLVDKMRWDTALAESDPFMNMLVEEKDMAFIIGDATTLSAEETVDKLAKASRKSVPRTIGDRLIPEDKQVFEYLESENKVELSKKMTNEQLSFAEYVRKEYLEMRDYLILNGQLENFIKEYAPHIRKDFMETLKEKGLLEVFGSIFDQQKRDSIVGEILAGETEEIISFEKWFQFAVKRTGVLDPSLNVENSFIAYKQAFERKKALDSVVPKIMAYVYALTPEKTTGRGLVMDRSLHKFVTSWLNSKKGRRYDFGGFVQQGGRFDTMLFAIKALTTLKDLAWNIPAQIVSPIGEQSANFVNLGIVKYTKGILRNGLPLVRSSKGQRILAKYKNFTGRSIWEELAMGNKNIGNKMMSTMYMIYHLSSVSANKQYLLGSLTKEEWQNERVSPEHLAQMKIEMGRWRVVDGNKSIAGNTSVGANQTQYKSWYLPILSTSVKNVKFLLKNWNHPIKGIQSREGQETLRQFAVLSLVYLGIMAMGGDDKDKTWLGKLKTRLIREAYSLFPFGMLLSTVIPFQRLAGLIADFSTLITQIITLEEYKVNGDGYKKGDLKAVNTTKRIIVPNAFKAFSTPAPTAPKKSVWDSVGNTSTKKSPWDI